MKIFIWEDVLYDYAAGMAVAYAETLEQALQTFIDKKKSYVAERLGMPTHIIDPEKDKTPFVAYVYGGG